MLMKFANFVVFLKKQLPFYCDSSIIIQFWVDLSFYIFNNTNMTHSLIPKDIIFITKILNIKNVNFFILCAKLFIRTGLNLLCFLFFLVEFLSRFIPEAYK